MRGRPKNLLVVPEKGHQENGHQWRPLFLGPWSFEVDKAVMDGIGHS